MPKLAGHLDGALGIVRAMDLRRDSRSSGPGASLVGRLVFASLGYGAGLLGVLAWGVLAGAVFLMSGGGIGDDPGEPVLPTMVAWASALAGPAVVMLLLMRVGDGTRAGQAPWSWMRVIGGSAAVLCAAGWLWMWVVG